MSLSAAPVLKDVEWKFGVTASSDQVQSVGTSFLHLRLVLQQSDGTLSDVLMELTLPQFYNFLMEMENIKAHLENLE